MLVFDCPSCGGKLQMPENLAGKKVRCATCQAVISAPQVGSDAIQAASAPAAAAPAAAAPPPTAVTDKKPAARPSDDDDRDDRRGPRRDLRERTAKSGIGAGAIIAVVAVLLVGCLVCGGGGLAFLLVFPAVGKVRDAAARTTMSNNMKQIGLAIHNHADSRQGALPPPKHVPLGAKDPVELSWRVTLLPFLDQANLFRAFDEKAAWDNPRNGQLANPMPVLYDDPLRNPGKAGANTFTQTFTGPNTLWPDNKGKFKISNIPDGASNTFLCAEAANDVTWTRPMDMVMQPNVPLPLPQDRFIVLMADGSVRMVERSRANDITLRQYIDPADGNVPLPID